MSGWQGECGRVFAPIPTLVVLEAVINERARQNASRFGEFVRILSTLTPDECDSIGADVALRLDRATIASLVVLAESLDRKASEQK